MLPRLYGVENTLSDIDVFPASQELNELHKLVECLANRLSSLRTNGSQSLPTASLLAPPPSGITGGISPTSCLAPEPSKRHKRKHFRAEQLRAPSPEAKQKRKVSNGVL